MRNKLKYRLIIAVFLTIQAVLLLNLNWMTSVNRTELGHIGAAVYFWKTGRFDLFCVNPPLTRILCGLPVFLAKPNYDWELYSPRPQDRAEWKIGDAFILANDAKHIRCYIFLARTMLLPLILLGGWLGTRFAEELYGKGSGVVFVLLWTFSPLFLGWGATICPDMASAAVGIIGIYSFWRWLRHPIGKTTLIAGICLGLMPLTKLTWMIAFGLYPALWGGWRISLRKQSTVKFPSMMSLAVLLCLGLYVINMGYLFEGTFRPLGSYSFLSATLTGKEINSQKNRLSGNRFAKSWLGIIPIPFPADLVQGLDTQKADFERGLDSYLNGESSKRGWKSYYLYVLLYKEPIGTLFLAFIALFITVWEWRGRNRNGFYGAFRDEMIPIFTALTLFIFVSLQDGISIHPRYILPAMPLAYLFISKTGKFLTRRKKFGIVTLGVFLLATIASSLSQYPHSLSFFNEFAGGVKNGPAHLLGSNADWGQSQYFLLGWCHNNGDRIIRTSVFTQRDKERYEIDNLEVINRSDLEKQHAQFFETGDYALSVTDIFDGDAFYSSFRPLTPIKQFGASIWIYRLETPLKIASAEE